MGYYFTRRQTSGPGRRIVEKGVRQFIRKQRRILRLKRRAEIKQIWKPITK